MSFRPQKDNSILQILFWDIQNSANRVAFERAIQTVFSKSGVISGAIFRLEPSVIRLHRMKIFVIRHGLTELNKRKIVNGQIDEPLAPEGIEQAHAAIALIPQSVQHIYHSPLLRAKHTAQIVNSTRQLPIAAQDEITEIHMGSLVGKSWEEMGTEKDFKILHRSVQFDYRAYGGESAEDVKKRVATFLQKINAKHRDHEVLLVTHGGIIRVLHMLESGMTTADEIENAALLTFDL